MPSSKSLKNSAAGFSLVELMITVAIIGILATIAVPNFNRFSSKAKQVEAKGGLSAAFTAEQLYFAEESTYTLCLYQAGYVPEMGTRRNYLTGFWNGARGNCGGRDCWVLPDGKSCSSTVIPWGGGARNDATYCSNRWGANWMAGGVVGGSYDVSDPSHFNVVGFGNIAATTVIDVWSINQDKKIINEQPAF